MDILVCPLLVIVTRKVCSFNYGTIFQLAGREVARDGEGDDEAREGEVAVDLPTNPIYLPLNKCSNDRGLVDKLYRHRIYH